MPNKGKDKDENKLDCCQHIFKQKRGEREENSLRTNSVEMVNREK